jgi:diguanylate cyclase (GGDEF)-like protein
MPASRDTVAGYLPLILSAAGALGVAPFVVVRWMDGDWVVAAIDTVIVAGFVGLGTYIYRTRRVRGASIALAVLCIIGALVTVYVGGVQQVYWAFPAVMACFYLLKPMAAIILTLSFYALIVPKIFQDLETFPAGTVAATLFLTTAFAYAFSVINNRQQEQLVNLATRDPLTGAGNRRAFEVKLAEVTSSFSRSGQPTSLIVLDLDHFKNVNDVHGHAVGDQILREVVTIVNTRTRLNDSLFRIGGEEFVVVADGQCIGDASHLAEQLRTLVEVNELVPNSAVTISLGVAEFRTGESPQSWLSRADAALYQAKREGRNLMRKAS